MNQLDDQLGHAVSWRRFAAEDESSRCQFEVRFALNSLQQGQNMQHQQVLALILMQPLDQDVEDRVRIGHNSKLLVNI